MNFICSFLLGMSDDEPQAFWVLCGLFEDILPRDFLSRDAAAMNGFKVAQDMASGLLKDMWALGEPADGVDMLMLLLAPHWFQQLWVDELPVEVTLMLWDCIFGETQLQVAKGSIGLHASTLACFSIASQNNASLKQVTEEGSCELSHKIRQQMHDITPSQMQHHLSQVDAWLQTVQDLSQREEACKKAKSAQWSIGRKLEWDLANGHHFTVDELKEIKAAYKDLVGAKDTGLSFVQLTVLLDRLPCPPPPEFTARVFQVYDTDTSRRIDLKQLVCCMSCLYRGSYQERLRLCFDVFDRDRSGFLSLPEWRVWQSA